MAQENIEDLSTEKLNRRRNFATVLLVILFIAIVLDVAIVIRDLIIGDGINTSLFVPAIACLVVSIPISVGLKKIKAELNGRKNK